MKPSTRPQRFSLISSCPVTPRAVTAALLVFQAVSIPLQAETVAITGANGVGGAPGTIGALSGGHGSPGSPAAASALTSGQPINWATAIGGWGGSGGNGYAGSSGNGGNGAVGGNATATAHANLTASGGGNVEAKANAAGGDGGYGGQGGVTPNLDGTPASDGTATATSIAVTTTGSAKSDAQAIGQFTATGPSTASASASNASADPVIVTATAEGGLGASSARYNGGLGSSASLGTVSGTSTGGGPVSVYGWARGGPGGDGAVIGGNGASNSLTNAVSGSTSGTLFLHQWANGGGGGIGPGTGGSGGTGSSFMTCNDTLAADLNLTFGATGGSGNGNAGTAASGISALHATATGHISNASVTAAGGSGGQGFSSADSGANGAPGIVNASSAVTTGVGKMVNLSADQVGGNGGTGGGGAGTLGGNGADSAMTNLLSGSAPSGTLTLSQAALAGSGGENPYNRQSSPGRGGDAVSTLNLTHSGEAKLDVSVRAVGGASGSSISLDYPRKRGGHGTASGTVQDNGDVTLTVKSQGGEGKEGGNTSSTASAISTAAGKVSVLAEATGGSANGAGISGLPGNASLTAYGQSQSGDVTVTGHADAGGGDFGTNSYPSFTTGKSMTLTNAVSGRTSGKLSLLQIASGGLGTAKLSAGSTAGAGGSAVSSLVVPGGNPDGGAIDAYASAYGGNSRIFDETQTPGTPGNATAVCDLHNAGDVHASAMVGSGFVNQSYSNTLVTPGTANATASAISSKLFSVASAYVSSGNSSAGSLSATAETLGGIITKIRANAIRPSNHASGLRVECSVGSPASGVNVGAAGLPAFPNLGPNATTAVQGMKDLANVTVSQGFSSASASVRINTASLIGNAKLALLSGSVVDPNAVLTAVNFTVTRGATTLLSQAFTDWSALTAYFNDHVIDLGGVGALNGQDLAFSFTLTGADASSSLTASLLVAATQTPLAAWTDSYGLTDLDATANADPDHDSLSNLVEFAFGLDPTDGSSVQLPQGQKVGENFVISFTQPFNVTGIIYGAESSATLLPGSWTPVTDTGSGDGHTFIIPSTGSLRKFMRMKVTSP